MVFMKTSAVLLEKYLVDAGEVWHQYAYQLSYTACATIIRYHTRSVKSIIDIIDSRHHYFSPTS